MFQVLKLYKPSTLCVMAGSQCPWGTDQYTSYTGMDGGNSDALRMGAGRLEDLQHADTGDVPHLGTKFLAVQDHQVLQAISTRPGQLLIVCKGQEFPLASCK